MNRNIKVAAAVAAALASGTSMAQLAPTPASAAAPAVGLYVAGSSAAKNAVLGSIEGTNVCGGTYSLFSSTGNTNFFAVSCAPLASTGLPSANGSTIYTIWYRAEGGSVVGALPLVSGSQINQMSLASATGTNNGTIGNYTVAVAGSSATNGIDDSFTGGVFKAPVQMGITDVEPGALIGDNYPTAYKTSAYGSATPTQLSGLTATTVFDQVFGLFVNTNSANFSAAEKAGQGTTTASLNLPMATLTNILQGNIVNWNDAEDTTGALVTTASTPIAIVNREQGSGSRTATSIFFTGDECVKGVTSIHESTHGTADFFSTGNVLAAANTNVGSITYASIDNAGNASFPNLTLVAVNGVTPSNLNAANGTYGDWFEATVVTGSNFSSLTADQQGLITTLTSAFQAINTAPHATDVLAIPLYNVAVYPPSGTADTTGGGKTIYINPFTRAGVSCNNPGSTI
jgi:hypothetical protein